MAKPRLSFNATTLRDFDIKQAVRLIRNAGYEGVEIALNDTHLHPLTSSREEVLEVKQICADIGLEIACIAAGGPTLLGEEPYEPSMISADKSARARRLDVYKKSIELAQLIGCPIVNINSGMLAGKVSEKQARAWVMEGVESLLSGLGANTSLVIEPEPGFFIGTTDKAIALLRDLDSPKVRLNLDIGHVFCSEEDGYNQVTKALPYTRHIHIEDIKDRIHHHEIPGEGDIDFATIMQSIRDAGYPYFISVELHHHDQMWERALEESRDYLLLEATSQIA